MFLDERQLRGRQVSTGPDAAQMALRAVDQLASCAPAVPPVILPPVTVLSVTVLLCVIVPLVTLLSVSVLPPVPVLPCLVNGLLFPMAATEPLLHRAPLHTILQLV